MVNQRFPTQKPSCSFDDPSSPTTSINRQFDSCSEESATPNCNSDSWNSTITNVPAASTSTSVYSSAGRRIEMVYRPPPNYSGQATSRQESFHEGSLFGAQLSSGQEQGEQRFEMVVLQASSTFHPVSASTNRRQRKDKLIWTIESALSILQDEECEDEDHNNVMFTGHHYSNSSLQ